MQFPITISNIHGETLTFVRLSETPNGKILEVAGEVLPKAGPPMHVHWKQDEAFTVEEGLIGYKTAGSQDKFAGAGEEILFKAGTPHKFWNAGPDLLKIKGWVTPPNNIVYFLGEIYKSMNENNGRPGSFDAAWLLRRYRSEFRMDEIPAFVQKVIFPLTLFFGTVAGKHKKFSDAPPPVL